VDKPQLFNKQKTKLNRSYTMKKLFAVIVAIALVASFTSAQELWGQGKMSAGVGAEFALPMGSVGDLYGIGIGGAGLFQYGLNEDILLTGQVGYTSFAEKTVGIVKSSMTALTILVGGKYNLASVTPGFYGMLQLGIYSASEKGTGSIGVYSYSLTVSSSEFVFAPGVGMQFGPIDASVKYVINSAVGNLALNVMYVMPL
jgi:hypothetical protein